VVASIDVGTSGWSYDEWVGPVYPPGLKPPKRLDFYTRLFHTVEIDSSFYNIPSEVAIRSWASKAPEGFTYAAKIYKGITHDAKLDPEKYGDGLARFMDRFRPLDHIVHAYLLQLPPSFSKDNPAHLDNLVRFLETWERSWPPEKLAVEVRNQSWFVPDTFELLREHGVVYAIPIEPDIPDIQEITCPSSAYIRFHGFGTHPMFNYKFSDAEIQEWVPKIKNIAGKVRVHVYFNNHFSGYAVQNALTLMDFLDIPHVDLETVQHRFSPGRGQQHLF